MKIFRCDRCKVEAPAVEGEDYAEDWDTVTISGTPPYHLCAECANELFKWIETPPVPTDGADSSPAASPEVKQK